MPDSTARDILVLAAHPDLARSQVTRTLLDTLRASPAAERVELRDLYRLYPDFHIHVDAEQRALQQARLVVMLHPIYWYSMPALQKLWLDDVLRLGWAYGPAAPPCMARTSGWSPPLAAASRPMPRAGTTTMPWTSSCCLITSRRAPAA